MSVVAQRILLTFLLLVLLLGCGAEETTAPASAGSAYLLATASAGGTYYPVGVALGTLTKIKLQGGDQGGETPSLTAITSAGSGENIRLLRTGEVQFAILQGLYGAWAWRGEGQLEREGEQRYLRSVTMLWQNVEHFVVRSELAPTGTITDLGALAGKSFSIGPRNSGTEGSGREILGQVGVDAGSFHLVHVGYAAGAEALQNGTAVGMNTPAGVPVAAVTQAFAAMEGKLRVLDFSDEQVGQVNRRYGVWSRYVIPAGTYPGQDREIRTIAQPNFLAVHQDVAEDDVYRLTRTIYENLGFLRGIHRATSAMSLEAATRGLPLPLHPGAARYYREAGLDLPADLVSP